MLFPFFLKPLELMILELLLLNLHPKWWWCFDGVKGAVQFIRPSTVYA